METNLLDKMLETYVSGRIPVIVTLQNKIRISGLIMAFDSYVIVMAGHKREIVYRHAIASLSRQALVEQKRHPAISRPATTRTAAPAHSRASSQKPSQKPAQPEASSTIAGEQGLNNTLKDALLKWMQEQKAAK